VDVKITFLIYDLLLFKKIKHFELCVYWSSRRARKRGDLCDIKPIKLDV